MLVCLCYAVSEEEVRDTIADGATTLEAVAAQCGAGSGCGSCQGMVADMIEEARACSCGCAARLETCPARRDEEIGSSPYVQIGIRAAAG